MKVKKEVVNAIIKEEAYKIKKLMQLQEQKKRLESTLNELYDDELEEETQQNQTTNPELGLDVMEEGLFGTKLSPDNVDNELKKKMDNYYSELLKKYPNGKRPNWATPGTPQWEKTKQAALQLGSTDIYWNKNKGQFLKRGYSVNGHTFGGGAGMEEGFFRNLVGMTDKPTPENVEQGLQDFLTKKFKNNQKALSKLKEWLGVEGNEMWEKAKKAALKYKTFDIFYDPREKDFIPYANFIRHGQGRVGE